MTAILSGRALPLLVGVAVLAGGAKIAALARANRELDRRNRAYAETLRELERAWGPALPRGAPAPEFTVLGLGACGADRWSCPAPAEAAPPGASPASSPPPPGALGRWPLAVRPAALEGELHLVFADPATEDVARLLEGSRASDPRARVLVLTAGSYEAARDALRRRPLPWPVAVHAAQVYAAYGIRETPALAVVERGTLRERWRLPLRGDELPVD